MSAPIRRIFFALTLLTSIAALAACEYDPVKPTVGTGGAGADGGSGGGGSGGGDAGSGGDGGGTAGSGGGTAGSGGDAGSGGEGGSGGKEEVAPVVNEVARLGAFQPSPPQSLLIGVDRPVAIIGLNGALMEDSALFGIGDPASPGQPAMSSGLMVQDTDSGEVRHYGAADGLPEYNFGLSIPGGMPAAGPVFRLAWVEVDRTFAAAMYTHVTVGAFDEDGAVSFRSAKLRRPGATSDARIMVVSAAGGAIFAGSDQGVAVIDPDDLSAPRWLETGTAVAEVYELVAVDFGAPMVAVAWNATQDAGGPDRIWLASASDDAMVPVELPAGFLPTSFAGSSGALYLGGREPDGRGSIQAVVPSGLGYETVSVVNADDLASLRRTPFVPNRIAVSADSSHLFVGAQFKAAGGDVVSGVSVFDLVSNAVVSMPGRPVIDRRRPEADLLPWQTELLVADTRGNLWVAGRQRCSDVSLRTTGLWRIENIGADPEEARLVRPNVSGVRAISLDPVSGTTWLGLRDENPGLACIGYAVQASVCRLKADGSCEIYVPRSTENPQRGPVAVSGAAIAFGDPTKREFAIVPIGDESFVRREDSTRFVSTQYDPGVSLRPTAAAFGESGLWISSVSNWFPGFPQDPDDPSPIDWDKYNDRTPHGVGYLELGDDGAPTFVRRYSRNRSDSKEYDVPGLPSNHAWDVLPLRGERRALVALGVERLQYDFDHALGEPSDRQVGGGVALVDDGDVRVVSFPAGSTLLDVTALARVPNGDVFAVDATQGVFRIDLETLEAVPFAPAAWDPSVRATSLAVDRAGHVAVGTTAGLWIYGGNGKATKVTGRDHGTYWTLRFLDDGLLYAGADQGLVRVAIDGRSSLPSRLGPSGPLARTLWPLAMGCDGDEGCACSMNDECAPGLECGECGPETCSCVVPVERCDVNPGDLGCACEDDGGCLTSYECVGGSCATSSLECIRSCGCETDTGCPEDTHCVGGFSGASCMPDARSCLESCSCEGGDGCPATYHCEAGIMAPRCVPHGGDCADDCTCPENDGCPDGYQCQGGIAGRSCVEVLDPCLADCSCETVDLCLEGWHCEFWDDFQTCVEDPDPCLADCSCGGPGQCLPGYTCQSGIAGRSCVGG